MLKAALFGAALLASSMTRAAPPEKTFDLELVRGQVPAHQRVLRVRQGERVHLRVKSDAPGELHLHGYRLEATLSAGAVADIVFEAYATGRYPFEWHASGAPSPRSHHGPPLAALEVRPQ
jgi:hypothetical protein